MFSIILVRLPMWLTAITLFKGTIYKFISLFCMIIFILLDIYWLKVIYKNMNDKRGINYIKKNKNNSEIINDKSNKLSLIDDITCSTINETTHNSKSLFKLSNNNVTSNSFYIKKNIYKSLI